MGLDLKGRSFLKLLDFSPEEIAGLIDLADKLKAEKKILVKTYEGVGEMGLCLRVSTGERELMKIFIDALEEVDL